MEQLDISLCRKLSEKAGMLIGSSCPNLKSLRAAHCAEVVTDAVMKSIGSGCKLLQCFDFSYCKAVTDDGLEYLSQTRQSFSMLLANGLENISGVGLTGLLRNSSPTLQHLEISLLDPVSP